MKNRIQYIFLLLLMCISNVSISADANKLAYLMYDGNNWQVYILNIESGKSKKLTTVDYDISTVSWLGDGSSVFFCGIQGQAAIMNVSSGQAKNVQLPFEAINDAVLSPDGSKLAFSYISPGSINNKLWLMNIEENAVNQILVDMEGRQYDPKWSADSQELYFVSGVTGGAYGISKYSLTTKKPTKLIINGFYNLDVDAYKQGEIVYSSNVSGNFDIWKDDGITRSKLTTSNTSQSHPGWSKDGKHVYYESIENGVGNIWRVNLASAVDNMEHTQLTFSKDGARYPVVFRGME